MKQLKWNVLLLKARHSIFYYIGNCEAIACKKKVNLNPLKIEGQGS